MGDRPVPTDGGPSATDRPFSDGGEDENRDRTEGNGDANRGDRDLPHDESDGGFWPWSGRRRIRRLKRELAEVRAERNDLQDEAESLQTRVVEMEAELEELRETVEAVERKTFPVRDFVRSVGDSMQEADDELTRTDFGVGDVEVTLRSRFAGAEDGLSIQLPDPEEDVDPETLSTVRFRVARGISRSGGGRLQTGGVGVLGAEAGSGADLAEVPDVRERSLDGAREELSEAGFEVSVDPPEATEGTVIEQDPEPFSFGPEGATVHLVVAGAPPEG